MPGRSRKVYVRPPSVGAGSDVARSGTGCVPARPLTWLNAVRPSPVIRRSGITYVYWVTAGGVGAVGVSTFPFFPRRVARRTSGPPPWSAPPGRAAAGTAAPPHAPPPRGGPPPPFL